MAARVDAITLADPVQGQEGWSAVCVPINIGAGRSAALSLSTASTIFRQCSTRVRAAKYNLA
jgi:hypothetical protein